MGQKSKIQLYRWPCFFGGLTISMIWTIVDPLYVDAPSEGAKVQCRRPKTWLFFTAAGLRRSSFKKSGTWWNVDGWRFFFSHGENRTPWWYVYSMKRSFMKVYVEHFQTMWSNNWRILVALGPWVWKMTLSVQISWKIPCSLHVFSCNVCAENNDLHHANHAIPVACLLKLQSKRDEFSDLVQQLKNSFRRSPGSTWALSFFLPGSIIPRILQKLRNLPQKKSRETIWENLGKNWNWCW
jgi:hypothetical protein